ncbi:APC family permease [Paraburkholderia unamae]|uniref:Aspartate/glutamate:proton symporter (AGT family) n=1 Tax=Paraburkholderia unamae TaxID=219649 RepID=A0ABX5KED6_9BURK|nr:APC family permease [Paraburkholderia unamae]PVX73206.1 aspartate/glutamate:proton symporter (AGT family) [Paraburkholderia unamae]
MSDSRHFKKSLSAFDLALIGFGTVFGSGWLFASSNVASIAGPAGIFSWLIAGIAVLALGVVYCELGAAIPSPGGAISYLDLSHGPMVTYLMGLMTVIYMSSIVGLEVVAARQYAAAWWPALNVAGTSNASTLGWFVQLGLIVFFFGLNFSSVRTFALANNIITTIKFVVPAIIVVTLLMHFKPANFHVAGFAPHGFSGIEAAVSTGGVIFAFLGLTPIVAVASEVRDPQRSIPIALVSSIIAAGVVYILLQVAFLGAVPTAMLSGGWESVGKKLSLPFHDIAIQLGIAWLAVVVAIDAVVSPSGCGNIFFSATPRALYAWSNSGTFFKAFAKVDPKSGIPRRATWLTLALSVFWTLPFPSWEAMISVVSASLVVSYAVAPVSVAALRKSHPEMERPFRVKALGVVGPLAFVVATFIVYWTGWQNLCWLLGVQIALYAGYLIVMRKKTVGVMTFAQQIRSSLWVAGYYLLTLIASYLGPFGGIGLVPHPYDFLMVCAVALAVYHWGARTGAPREVKAHAEPSRYGKRSEENAYAEDLGECGV